MRYAQINPANGICISVSELSGEVNAPHMVLLSDEDNVNPLDTYDNGTWTAYVPPVTVPQPDPIEEVKAQNAELNLQIIDLFEQLISKGVL